MGSAKGITIEYSNDGGKTWLDYGATDGQKVGLISSLNSYFPFVIGKTKSATPANDMLRVTIDTGGTTGINCYTILNKFCLYISTSGSQGCYCTIQKALESTPTVYTDVATKVPISGWSGYNIINVSNFQTFGYKGTEATLYGRIRFIFGCTGNTSNSSGLQIQKIKAFGGVGWQAPSNLAKYGVPYTIEDTNSSVKFQSNITATQFNGNLNGNATSVNGVTPEWTGTAYLASTQYLTSWTNDGKKLKALPTSEIIKSVTLKDKTLTVTNGAGTSTTFTTQDTTYDAIETAEIEKLF